MQGMQLPPNAGFTGSAWDPRGGGWLSVAVRSPPPRSERASTYAEARVLQFGFWRTTHGPDIDRQG